MPIDSTVTFIFAKPLASDQTLIRPTIPDTSRIFDWNRPSHLVEWLISEIESVNLVRNSPFIGLINDKNHYYGHYNYLIITPF